MGGGGDRWTGGKTVVGEVAWDAARDGPLDAEGGAAARTHMDAEASTGGIGQLMDIAMAEASAGAGRQRRGMEEGGGQRRRHTGTVVLDAEPQAAGDHAEADVNMPAGELRGVDGFGGVAYQVDGDALQRLSG
jgi:hypothetical protein